MSETVTVTARCWSRGWELWNGDDCWTQVARLDRARQQVVDYLDTVDEGTDHSDWTITVRCVRRGRRQHEPQRLNNMNTGDHVTVETQMIYHALD